MYFVFFHVGYKTLRPHSCNVLYQPFQLLDQKDLKTTMFWWAIHFCRFLPSPYLFFGLCWDAQTPHALAARTNLIKLTIFEMGVEEMTPIRNRETLLSSVKLSLKRSHRKRAAPPIKTLLRRTLNGFLLEKKARRKSGPHFNFKFQLVAIALGAFSILAPPTFNYIEWKSFNRFHSTPPASI